MQFSPKTLAVFFLTVGGAAAFSRPAFAPSNSLARKSDVSEKAQITSCATDCVGLCCKRSETQLFSSETEAETAEAPAEEAPADEVPAEVAALDGIESQDEAHNADRPSRESLKKKTPPKGKALEEFEEGATIQGKVKTITSYGAFIDIGAETDGLLHISQLSKGFVSDVNEFCEIGQELEVRIVSIDKSKSQVALSLMTKEEAAEEQSGRRPQRQQSSNRRDDSAAVASLADKGWDSAQFVEGKVVSTVDFGAFVRVDVSQLNSEAEGEMDGLVHISALTVGRCNSVTDIINVDDTVKIRVKSIAGRKVSLSMITPEDEAEKGGGRKEQFEGAKDWKESLEKLTTEMPTFNNKPVVVDLRR